MARRTFTFLMLISLAASCSLQAGGPIYSRYGLGDLYYFGGSRAFAMGGAGVAFFGDGFINRLNPAGIAGITSTRFSGTFEFTNYNSTDPSGSSRYARGDFGGLSVTIPISKEYGVSLVGGMNPYSTVNYAVSKNDAPQGISALEEFYGSGGITRLDFGSSVGLTNHIHLGVKLNHLVGTIRNTSTMTFSDNTYSNNELTLSDHYSGFLYTIGGTIEGLGGLVDAPFAKSLVLGFVVETPASIDVREQRFVLAASQYDTLSTQIGTADIPLFLAVGATYTFADRYVLAAQLSTQDWSAAKSLGVHPIGLRNSFRVGGGFEIHPKKDADSYVGHIIYRAGAYYNSSYLELNNQGINSAFVTAGVGLPIGTQSLLNVGVQYGVNGTTTAGLQQDNIFRLTVSISGSELWFIRLPEE